MTASNLPGMDSQALLVYLSSSGREVIGALRIALINGGRSNLTYSVRDDKSHWVVRRPPTAGLTPSAHDMVREWRVTSGLQATSVPVPPTVALCEDPAVLGAPFTVVEFVEGRVIRTDADLADLDDDEIQRCATSLVGTLVDLHSVDVASAGLMDFGKPMGFVQRQVALWARQWQQVKTRELPDIDRLHELLVDRLPGESEAAIIHGDFRVDNTILDDTDVAKVRAVVDWELSTIGDPLTDVALMCVYRQPVFDQVLGLSAAWTSERFPSPDELAQDYACRSARDLVDWPFYVGLANFKLAVIAEGISHRARSGFDAGSRAENAASATPELVAAGLRALAVR